MKEDRVNEQGNEERGGERSKATATATTRERERQREMKNKKKEGKKEKEKQKHCLIFIVLHVDWYSL